MNKAFNILAQQHQAMLLNYVKALCYGDSHMVEDVVQEAFLAAQQQIDSFREGESFGRWLRGIARNKALEVYRASQKGKVVTDSRVIEGMEEVYGALDESLAGEEQWTDRIRRWMRHCTNLLSVPHKTAVVRVYIEGMSLREAAVAEKASFDAFAQRLSRAREQIRKCVQIQSERES